MLTEVVQWLRLALSNGPNRVGVSHPHIWIRKQIQFPWRCVLWTRGRRTKYKPPGIPTERKRSSRELRKTWVDKFEWILKIWGGEDSSTSGQKGMAVSCEDNSEIFYLLECDAMYYDRSLTTFRRSLQPPPTWSKNLAVQASSKFKKKAVYWNVTKLLPDCKMSPNDEGNQPSSKTSVNEYQTTRHHVLEHCTLHSYCRENFKPLAIMKYGFS
jgi:hypothetical protein